MLDQHDGDAVAGQPADDGFDLGGLHRIAARGGLVEQQQLGLARKRACDFKALETSEGESARRSLRRRGEPDALERGRGRLAGSPVLPADRRQMKQVGEYAGRFVAMAADHDIFERSHAEEDLQVLERARQAPARELFRRKRAHLLAGKPHAALRGQVETGDEIEQRGLAGAVRADDRKDEAGRDCQAHVFDRVHAAEGDREVLGNEDHARLKSSARASVGTMPARKKTITAMTMRPSAMCS